MVRPPFQSSLKVYRQEPPSPPTCETKTPVSLQTGQTRTRRVAFDPFRLVVRHAVPNSHPLSSVFSLCPSRCLGRPSVSSWFVAPPSSVSPRESLLLRHPSSVLGGDVSELGIRPQVSGKRWTRHVRRNVVQTEVYAVV